MGIHIDDVEEHLQVLLKQENAVDYQVDDYLGDGSRKMQEIFWVGCSLTTGGICAFDTNTATCAAVANQWSLTSQGRWQIGQWFYRIIADFKFPREFAMVAMNYLDRVFSKSVTPPQSKGEVQLIALTCLYLAVKLFQAGPVLSTEQMALLSGGTYSAQQVSATERRILFALQWSVHPPCAADFVRPFFMVIMRNSGFPPDLSHYDVLELALGTLHTGILDYFFIENKLPPSHMAAAALLNAMHAVLPVSFDIPSVQDFIQQMERNAAITLHEGQINLCRQRLWALLDRTGLSEPCSSDNNNCPTSPPTGKRAKNDAFTPLSPHGVVDFARDGIKQLQAPFQV